MLAMLVCGQCQQQPVAAHALSEASFFKPLHRAPSSIQQPDGCDILGRALPCSVLLGRAAEHSTLSALRPLNAGIASRQARNLVEDLRAEILRRRVAQERALAEK